MGGKKNTALHALPELEFFVILLRKVSLPNFYHVRRGRFEPYPIHKVDDFRLLV